MDFEIPTSYTFGELGLSGARCARVYGVDYIVFDDAQGGELYVTNFGMPVLPYLTPSHWYQTRRYVSHGQRLMAGTGNVYRMQACDQDDRPLDFVVKFSRFAQEVPLDIRSTFTRKIDPDSIDRARFLDPFHEFGRLRDLRRGLYGPKDLRIMTKRPLAIYKAPESEPAWRLGRLRSRFNQALHDLEVDQVTAESPVSLEMDHTYVLLFHWVRGMDVQEAHEAGLVSQDQVAEMTQRVADELAVKGFQVLDHKPQHIIVRPRDGKLASRRGPIDYALVDFELLERTDEYKDFLVNRASDYAV